jgi:glucose/mannose transport system substrate-binding protein
MKKTILITGAVILTILLTTMLIILIKPSFLFQGERNPNKNSAANTLEIFSWWTAGGEADALESLYKLYTRDHPGTEIINATVVGGAGTNAHVVLKRRMEGYKPADAFQIHAGPELIETWAKRGLLEPVTSIYNKNNWMDSFSSDVINKISYEGEVYAIPLNIHRGNVIWYNTEIFTKYDIKIPKTFDDFIFTMELLAEQGITPLALGDKNTWPAMRILENLLIQSMGPEGYESLWKNPDSWDSNNLGNALRDFLKILDYTNSDHSALTWDESVQYVIDGKCAMITIGDFAEGYFRASGSILDQDFGWFPFPDTDGVFSMFCDSFALPRYAEHKENAMDWMFLLGTKEAQDVFNPIKGSISPRLDSDTSLYDKYLTDAYVSFLTDYVVSSFVHGAAINAEWENGITEITRNLMIDSDIPKALKLLQSLAGQHVTKKP